MCVRACVRVHVCVCGLCPVCNMHLQCVGWGCQSNRVRVHVSCHMSPNHVIPTLISPPVTCCHDIPYQLTNPEHLIVDLIHTPGRLMEEHSQEAIWYLKKNPMGLWSLHMMQTRAYDQAYLHYFPHSFFIRESCVQCYSTHTTYVHFFQKLRLFSDVWKICCVQSYSANIILSTGQKGKKISLSLSLSLSFLGGAPFVLPLTFFVFFFSLLFTGSFTLSDQNWKKRSLVSNHLCQTSFLPVVNFLPLLVSGRALTEGIDHRGKQEHQVFTNFNFLPILSQTPFLYWERKEVRQRREWKRKR